MPSRHTRSPSRYLTPRPPPGGLRPSIRATLLSGGATTQKRRRMAISHSRRQARRMDEGHSRAKIKCTSTQKFTCSFVSSVVQYKICWIYQTLTPLDCRNAKKQPKQDECHAHPRSGACFLSNRGLPGIGGDQRGRGGTRHGPARNARLQNPCHRRQLRRTLCLRRAGMRLPRPQKSRRRGRRKIRRDDQIKTAPSPHRIHPRRMLSHRHEKILHHHLRPLRAGSPRRLVQRGKNRIHGPGRRRRPPNTHPHRVRRHHPLVTGYFPDSSCNTAAESAKN